MTINHPQQTSSGQGLQTTRQNSPASTLAASQAVDTQQPSQQLTALKNALGETASAKILSITQRSRVEDAAELPTRHRQTSHQPGQQDAAKYPVAGRLSKETPDAPTAKPIITRVWQIALQIAGLTRPLTTELVAPALPAGLKPGQLLTLKIDPQNGLRFGPSAPDKAASAIEALMQALSRFIPIQDNLKNQLSPLLTLALNNGVLPKVPAQTGLIKHGQNNANSVLLMSLQGDKTSTVLPPTKISNTGASAPLKALAEQMWQRLAGKLIHSKSAQQSTGTPLNPMSDQANKSNGANHEFNSRSLSPLINTLLKELLNSTLTPSQSADPQQLKAGLIRSGISMEAKLLARPETTRNLAKDIRTWLKQLPGRQTPGAQQPPGTSPLLKAVPGDLKALLLTALVVFQHHANPNSLSGLSAGQQGLPANWESLLSWLMPRLATAHSGQHPLLFPAGSNHNSIAAQRGEGMEAGELLRALVQTLARIQVNQLNALQMNAGTAGETGSTQYWFMELPILGQQLDTVQIRLEKQSQSKQKTRQKHQWRIILSFDFAQLGPLQSQVLYTNGTVSATFWADQTKTLQLINTELPSLRRGLKEWGVIVGDLAVRRGNPPAPDNPVSHQLLDEKV